jgi:hypothetical protein
MRAGHCQGPVTNSERDSLRCIASNVASGEDTRAGGLDRAWFAVREGPAARSRGIGAGEDEALGVDGDVWWEPAGTGLRTDEDEQSSAIKISKTTLADVAKPERRKRLIALDGNHLNMMHDVDFLVAFDPVGEVVGHALAEVSSAQEQRDRGRVFSQKHRRLAR